MQKGINILILLVLFSITAFSQEKSNRGKEFWLGYGYNYKFVYEPPLNNQEMALYISTVDSANVVVSINGTSWTSTLHISPNTVDASILIPKSGANDARILSDGLSNKGIHIVSDVPVAVYAHCFGPQVSGATMLLPVETYGFSYYSINYYQTKSQSNVQDWYSWFYVIASEDNTKVLITPSDTTKNGWLPGQTYTVSLNKGEMYNVFGKAGPFNTNNYDLCSKDMTGSKIVSTVGPDGTCHPIAVFSGSSGIRLCRGDGGEFMHQQVFPSQAWGTRYLTYHTINNTSTDINETNRNIYRVCVSDPSTVVKKNGVTMSGLINNFFYEYMDSTGGDYIESDRPVLVSQYTVNKNQCWNYPTTSPSPPSYGDPEMFYLSPIEQGQKSVLFYTSRKSTIDYVYANIYVPTNAVGSLKIDGNPLPASQIIVHPHNANYSVALARFIGPAATHRITCDSALNASVYGLGNYESYGYNVGTLINNLNYYSSINNTQKTSPAIDTFSCPNTPLRIYLKVGFPASKITWKLSQVNGISPSADSIVTNPVPIGTESINGRSYYVYTLQHDFIFNSTGTYIIPVTYAATVIENCSQSENATIQIIIKPGPAADFSINSSGNNCVKDSVQFAGIVNAAGFNIVNYLWNFNDGTSANTLNTAKKFVTLGIQPVRFRAFADNGCVADTFKNINIQPAAIASFTLPDFACEKDSVQITDNSTAGTGNITHWQWNYFNSSHIETNNTPFKLYFSTPGIYQVSLIITNSNGCKSDTTIKNIQINPKPISKFGYSGNICLGDSIRFSDSSFINSGTITKWNWQFGNSTSTVKLNSNPFYWNFSITGSFIVTLTTESTAACISEPVSLTVTVNNRPIATTNLSGSPCIDSTLTFSSSINNGPATWYWNFGDGQSSTSNSAFTVQHIYTGTFQNLVVQHVVSYGPGCTSDTAKLTIPSIYKSPSIALSLASDTLCQNKPIVLNATTSDVNVTWAWSIEGSILTQPPPLHYTFNKAGSFQVQLKVAKSFCNSAPATTTINIQPAPELNAGPDKVINPGNAVMLNASLNNSVDYKISWTPGVTLNDSTVLNPVSTPVNPTTYTIFVINKVGLCTASDKVFVNVVAKLKIPNAFSPNGDGINDTWQIEGLELYPGARVSIFSRYGQNIFESFRYTTQPWTGAFKETPLPVGSYAYIIQLNNTTKDILSGTVILLR